MSRKRLHLLGVIIAMGLGSFPISLFDHEFADTRHLLFNELYWWGAVALILLFVRRIEIRPLSSIGFRNPRLTGWMIGIAGGIVMLAGIAAIVYVLFPALHLKFNIAQANQLHAQPTWWLIISTVRAAVAEEVLFRGYSIERLQEISGSRAFAAIFSCAVFSFAHATMWGWPHLIIAGFGGIFLTVLYLWRRNLWVTMVTHFIVDMAGMLG